MPQARRNKKQAPGERIMAALTPEGEKIVATLAEQYKIGSDAVKLMLDAVAKGGGGAAQFNLPEFGGAGHWMRGGGVTVGDMVNASMKGTVDNLCTELSNLMEAQASLFAPGSQAPFADAAGYSPSKTEPGASPASPPYGWWPAGLGKPTTAGSRNQCRYAYFASIRRLAVDVAGKVEVYDTTGFEIEGLAAKQTKGARPLFASNRGSVKLDSLPRVYSLEAQEKSAPEPQKPETANAVSSAAPNQAAARQNAPASDAAAIVAIIEQLAALKDKGILTQEEFAAKKTELLKRI
jgi:Short C-terminal domain